MNTVKLVKNLEIDDLNTTRLGDTFKSEDIRITIIKRNGKFYMITIKIEFVKNICSVKR